SETDRGCPQPQRYRPRRELQFLSRALLFANVLRLRTAAVRLFPAAREHFGKSQYREHRIRESLRSPRTHRLIRLAIMKYKSRICWILLALCLLPRLCTAVLLSNPGFESGVTGNSASLPGWQKYNTNAYNLSNPAIARSGTNFLKVYQS